MSKHQHTAGPWMVSGNEVMTTPRGDIKICRVYAVSLANHGEANARLIAAAPELLETLEDVAATKSLIMKRSPSELELQEILKTFERVNQAIKKAIEG